MAKPEDIKLKDKNQSNAYGAAEGGDDDDDYDPHLHRVVEHPTTNLDTLIHLLKGALGTGILAMPEAFKYAGLINGMVWTLFIGFICTYGLHVLIKAQYVLCKRTKTPLLSYPESMKLALETGPKCLRIFAPMSPLLVDIFLIIYQLGICCVYIVFVGVNIKAVCDQYTSTKWDVSIYIAIFLIPFMLMNCIRNLKLLSPFSALANVLTFVSFGIVCYYIFQHLPRHDSVPYMGPIAMFPLFFGTTLFALEAVGVVIALEGNMKTPKSFLGWFGVLNIGMFIVTILYFAMGYIGYWRYKDDIAPSITLNFPQEDVAAKIVRILYSIAIFISYGLQAYVPVDILWRTYILKHLKSKFLLWEYVLRISSVIVTFILAISIPLLGLFISLFGAFCLSALGIAFPAIMDICVKHPNEHGRGKWILIKNILLIIFGIIGLVAGSYTALSEIVKRLTETTPIENPVFANITSTGS